MEHGQLGNDSPGVLTSGDNTSRTRLAQALAALLLFASLALAVPASSADAATPVELQFTFDTNAEGWATGFADLPANYEHGLYELESGHRQLPDGLEGGAVYMQGHNRSDDLFMFLKKRIAGLVPESTYRVKFLIRLATNVPEGLVGIGGSPGESVYVKAGASTVEPTVTTDALGDLRMNIDKGNQATGGEDMIVLGNVAHPDVLGVEYRIKTLDNPDQPLEASTDTVGRLWLIAGTDSGFEGPTSVYYDSIEVTLEPVDGRPIALPETGDVSLPDSAFAGMIALGLILAALGTFALARRSS